MLIQTEHGRLRFDRTNGNLLFKLRAWPKGIHRLDLDDQEVYGIMIGDKLGEEWGLKFHFGYIEGEEHAKKVFLYNRYLLSEAIATYVSYGFDGLLLPCAYLKTGESRYCETGYVMFGRSNSRSASVIDAEPIELYEQMFGAGATNMFFGFVKATGLVWNATGRPQRTISEFCIESPSYLGSMALDFLILGSDIVCLHRTIAPHYQCFYDQLAKAGIKRIYHLPSVAAKYIGESSC